MLVNSQTWLLFTTSKQVVASSVDWDVVWSNNITKIEMYPKVQVKSNSIYSSSLFMLSKRFSLFRRFPRLIKSICSCEKYS